MADVPQDPAEQLRLFRAIDPAFRAGNFASLTILLGSNRWFDEPLPWGYGADYPLQHAIQHSPFVLIEAMLKAGANPNGAGQGFTPIATALSAGLIEPRADHLDIIRLLVASGADIDGRSEHNWTPLHHAVRTKDAPAIQLLLSLGADPNLSALADLPSIPLDDARLLAFNEGVALLEAA